MKLLVSLVLVSALSVAPLFGQTGSDTKQMDKDGLAFNYPAKWELVDRSNTDAQQFTLAMRDTDAQIHIFVFRTKATTPEQVAEAKRVLLDPYVNSTAKQFEQMGAKPERIPATSEIAGTAAEGTKVQAVLEGETGAAEIYSAVLAQRLVVLTFFGPDRARKQAAGTWDLVRNSLKVTDLAPAKPSPSPK